MMAPSTNISESVTYRLNHRPTNQEVAASSPAGRTNICNQLPHRPFGPVNNCEQFGSDLLDGVTHGAVEDLRVHIQRRIDVAVAHELSDHLAGYAFVVRPRGIRTPEREPRRVGQLQLLTGR